MNDFNYTDYSEMMRDARRGLEREREQLEEKAADLNNVLKMMEVTDEIMAERDRWQQEAEALREQLQEAGEREARLEMQLKEMQKLSASVAGKASQDEVLKALSTFVKKSKQKRLEKRVAVKEMVLELANANSIVFPEDVATLLDALDDERPEPKVVNVSGNYNDIHDNREIRV
jgi:chromosome segregation ATPase